MGDLERRIGEICRPTPTPPTAPEGTAADARVIPPLDVEPFNDAGTPDDKAEPPPPRRPLVDRTTEEVVVPPLNKLRAAPPWVPTLLAVDGLRDAGLLPVLLVP